MSDESRSEYFTNIKQTENNCTMVRKQLDNSHPRKIITVYNGINPETKEDHELSYYNTEQIIAMCESGQKFDPKTRIPHSTNQLKRIAWYKECLEKFPEFSQEELSKWREHIDNWLANPTNVEYTDIVRYFVTYEQIIEYFGFKDIDTREKAEAYFESNPDKTWVIRKSSVKDTRYNQFFVIMTKNPKGGYYNILFVHRQGYGICNVIAGRYADTTSVILDHSIYYTNIVDLLIHYRNSGQISF